VSTDDARPSSDADTSADRTAATLAAAATAYGDELHSSGLLAAIAHAKLEFDQTVSGTTPRGDPYGFGGMRPEVATALYGLIRASKPRVLVETGVCNGESTALILAALERNGAGELHSIDLPEIANVPSAPGAFWSGKKGAVIPSNRQPGWVIPDQLRGRWALTIGRSQDVLGGLLQRLPAIDFFMHDSEHSVECMRFEYETAWPRLRAGGVLASDDIAWNDAFEQFCRRVHRQAATLGGNAAFIVR
jgi:predicted O-methyltransferase YrrM